MKNLVEIAVKQPLFLQLGAEEYRIEFPLAAVIEAEEKLGRSLKSPGDWFGAPAKDIPVLLRAGLSKNHPDVSDETIQEICDGLGPEGTTEFTQALGAVAFPRWLARYKESLEKLQAQADATGVRETPKAQSADGL